MISVHRTWQVLLRDSSLIMACLAMTMLYSLAEAAPNYQQLRNSMLDEIEEDVRRTALELGKDKLDERIIQALRDVPRHEFVPEELQEAAYYNRPLPIGYGQTISQPYIVAIMTDLLDLKDSDTIFELGTGSGYQAAVLSRLVKSVYTMEIISKLGERASKDLERLGYNNVSVRVGDGYFGWEEHAPFDAIIITAAGDHIPPPLIEQLKTGGKMIIPIGGKFMVQYLMLIEKTAGGKIKTREILPVRFVPITGKH